MSGEHDICITNDTEESEIYEIFVEIRCVDKVYNYKEYVQVNANGKYTDSMNSFIIVQEGLPGAYEIDAATTVGEPFDTSSFDQKWLSVVD